MSNASERQKFGKFRLNWLLSSFSFCSKIFQLLKRVDGELLAQLKQSARATTDSPVIRNCETLVLSWMNSIENVLQDIFGEE